MKDKVWIRTEISTELEQDINIQPNDSWTGIEVAFKDSSDDGYVQKLYLDEVTLEAFIAKMREMMEHVKK